MLNIQIVEGDGPEVVLMLHGFLGSARNLASVARRWSQQDPRVKLVLPDLTGHSRSPPLPPNPTFTPMARDILELCEQLAVQRIVGHSLGGRVALAARTLMPSLSCGITLLDIAPGPTPSTTGALDAALDALVAAPVHAKTRPVMAEYFHRAGIDEPLTQWLLLNLHRTDAGFYWRADRERLRELHRNSAAADFWSGVEDSPYPTRCIRGGDSHFVGDADAARMERAGCPVTTIDGAGHFIHVDRLRDLVDQLAAGGAP